MNDPLEFVPPYYSPLTDKQHAQIGRIAVLWGQIEWMVERLIPRVSHSTWQELTDHGVVNRAFGSKIEFLRSAAKAFDDEDIATQAIAICDAINNTKNQRNHLFHGVWGWRTDDRKRTVFPAARKSSAPHAPLAASQLSTLEKNLCRCARLCDNLLSQMAGHSEGAKYRRFFHGKESLPEWFAEWCERNPSDIEELSRTPPGQLPRLAVSYPTK